MPSSKKGFFHFTASERRGTSIFIALCFIILISPKITPLLFPKTAADEILNYKFTTEEPVATTDESKSNYSWQPFNANEVTAADLVAMGLSEKRSQTLLKYRKAIRGFKKVEDIQKVYGLTEEEKQQLVAYAIIPKAQQKRSQQATHVKETYELFAFDPNTVTAAELRKMGVRPAAIKNLINYRNAGATFRSKADLKKLYSWKATDYERVADYIEIAVEEQPVIAAADSQSPTSTPAVPRSYENVNHPAVIIDINRASQEEWEALKGIGPYYAKRIVRFREALGGFSSVDQVAATHHLPDSVFQNILLSLRPSPVYRPLEINWRNIEELKSHPYLSWKEARLIIRYREQHGDFYSLEDVQKIQALSAEKIKQIAPYLSYEVVGKTELSSESEKK
ncbi:MAG: helix-hairpin-helix domain-containing protein [Bacteroidota bacterium]